MLLGEYLSTIAATYDRNAGLSTPAQLMLRNAETYLGEHASNEFMIKGSGGQGVPTFSPWIAFLLPSETTTVQDGLYVVYLFSRELEKVTLSLNQGVTVISNRLGGKTALIHLRKFADDIRIGLPKEAMVELGTVMELGGGGWRQRAYVAGTIVARDYSIDSLPPEQDLIQDLNTFLNLYQQAALIKFASSIVGDPVAEVKAAVRGQGFNSSSKSRVAVELAAMKKAIAYYQNEGWHVDDMSSNNPYDLKCTKPNGVEIHVEVKGTTSDGSSVLLTHGEVRHARQYPKVALYILCGQTLQKDSSGNVEAVGGREKIIDPWDIDTGTLKPIQYEYFPSYKP